MTYEEAIKWINNVLNSDYHYDDSLGYQLTSDDFEWLELAIEALEKQIPKKPIIKSEKEIPITHNYGRLLRFHCPRCERFLVGLYETDVERGGGISRRMKGCSTCLQAIDFTGYYYIGKTGDEIDWGE